MPQKSALHSTLASDAQAGAVPQSAAVPTNLKQTCYEVSAGGGHVLREWHFPVQDFLVGLGDFLIKEWRVACSRGPQFLRFSWSNCTLLTASQALSAFHRLPRIQLKRLAWVDLASPATISYSSTPKAQQSTGLPCPCSHQCDHLSVCNTGSTFPRDGMLASVL